MSSSHLLLGLSLSLPPRRLAGATFRPPRPRQLRGRPPFSSTDLKPPLHGCNSLPCTTRPSSRPIGVVLAVVVVAAGTTVRRNVDTVPSMPPSPAKPANESNSIPVQDSSSSALPPALPKAPFGFQAGRRTSVANNSDTTSFAASFAAALDPPHKLQALQFPPIPQRSSQIPPSSPLLPPPPHSPLLPSRQSPVSRRRQLNLPPLLSMSCDRNPCDTLNKALFM
jgi:hypothetical protein